MSGGCDGGHGGAVMVNGTTSTTIPSIKLQKKKYTELYGCETNKHTEKSLMHNRKAKTGAERKCTMRIFRDIACFTYFINRFVCSHLIPLVLHPFIFFWVIFPYFISIVTGERKEERERFVYILHAHIHK